MLLTYGVYYGMTLLSCVCAWFAQKNRGRDFQLGRRKLSQATAWLILAALPMAFVSGFRWDVGVDSLNYFYVYSNILYGYNTHVEIGFELLCRALLLITEDVSLLFLVCAVITTTLVIAAVRRGSSDYFLSVFLYIALGYFFYSMNSIRHYMALAIFLFAYRWLKEKKLLPYIAAVLAAACFHKIALVALPLYFLLNIKWKPYWYAVFGGGLLAVSFFHRQILDFIYQFVFGFYQSIEAEYVSVSWFNIAVALALSALVLYYRKKLLARGDLALMNAAWFGLLFFALCSWIPDYTRIGQYCLILLIFLVPEILACEERPPVRRVYFVGILAGGLAFLAVMIWRAQNPNLALAPYQFLFTRDSYPLHRLWF